MITSFALSCADSRKSVPLPKHSSEVRSLSAPQSCFAKRQRLEWALFLAFKSQVSTCRVVPKESPCKAIKPGPDLSRPPVSSLCLPPPHPPAHPPMHAFDWPYADVAYIAVTCAPVHGVVRRRRAAVAAATPRMGRVKPPPAATASLATTTSTRTMEVWAAVGRGVRGCLVARGSFGGESGKGGASAGGCGRLGRPRWRQGSLTTAASGVAAAPWRGEVGTRGGCASVQLRKKRRRR